MGRRRSTVLAADGARLLVVVDGAEASRARATVLLAHGWTLTHHTWDLAVDRLLAQDDRLRVVRWDHREHGRSTAGRDGRPPSVRRLAHDVQRVLATQAPEGPLVLGGHSMGGMAVMAWAAQHPDAFERRVLGTLLVGTAAGELAATHLRRRLTLLTGVLSLAPAGWRTPRLRPWQARRAAFGPAAPTAVIRSTYRREGWVRTRSLGRWYPAVMEHDERESLPRLGSRPVHLLVGVHDRITPPSFTDAIAAALPDAVVEHVADAGHMLPVERDDLVAAHLLDLVGRADR